MIPDFPLDLEHEILSRVPATSLIQLQSTCKRWYDLFKDPKFVKKNLNLGKAARKVILLMNFRVSSISLNLHGIHNGVDPSVEFTGTLNSLKDIKISTISQCNGLMLCSTKRNTRHLVWNPCTGETRWIKPRPCYKYTDKYVLGFGNNKSCSHSYKILMFYGLCNDVLQLHVSEYEIYDFSSDTWRVLDHANHNWRICSLGVTLKGNCYGIAFDNKTGFFMHSFDFTTERFGCLPLPYQSYEPEDDAICLSVVRDEQLSVLHLDFDALEPLEMKVWVTNKIDDEAKEVSWSKFFVVDLYKFYDGSIVKSFLVDEENKMVLCTMFFEDKIYIVGEDIHREVYKETTRGPLPSIHWPLLVSYVPSLVQIQKKHSTAIEKETQVGG